MNDERRFHCERCRTSKEYSFEMSWDYKDKVCNDCAKELSKRAWDLKNGFVEGGD